MTFAFDQEVSLFLATCRTASVATCHAALGPHAANVQYVSDEAFGLIWVSSPDSRHSRDFELDPRAAVTIYGHDDRAENIHGLQIHGVVNPIEEPDVWHRTWERYTDKFSFIRESPALSEAVRKQRFYRLTPTWLRWIDNRRGFGWKIEKTLAPSDRTLSKETRS